MRETSIDPGCQFSFLIWEGACARIRHSGHREREGKWEMILTSERDGDNDDELSGLELVESEQDRHSQDSLTNFRQSREVSYLTSKFTEQTTKKHARRS